jgi:cytochrome c peroxidase
LKMGFSIVLPCAVIFLTCAAAAADPLRDQAKGRFEPLPDAAPAQPDNPVTPEKVALGKMLYFDPRLAESNDISCGTCHNLSMGGGAGRAPAIGHNGQLGGRKAPTVLNALLNKSLFWDGRASGLKEQVTNSVMANPGALLAARGGAIAPNPADMTVAKRHAVERLKAIPGYAGPFKKAFRGEPDPITYDNVGQAIAAFESTLITPGAPFDRWLKGDDEALSEEQKQGLKIFMDKGCSNCHNGKNIGGGMYARFGAVKNPGSEFLPPDDLGRFALTKNVSDKYVFKVPSLRNVELTAPYFHCGRALDLKQAIAVMGESQLGQKLDEGEVEKLAAFLKSLTGRQPEVILPILPPSEAAPPRPQP